ncbi:hypothetical protein [Homoserinibacter sp. YIM 151385]|uniref:hypothetical protein n=1 Tax=Homoserinibacter sp. YIM 151385 TaxID=2985506 RepID=UPI0022F075C5|nr:hypothetical protein [Homoserinibacter sp. YIM 151385]WBU38530.1 hypothetical protein OF852_02790 [Homoserinibacter sp. YIM 151385]
MSRRSEERAYRDGYDDGRLIGRIVAEPRSIVGPLLGGLWLGFVLFLLVPVLVVAARS